MLKIGLAEPSLLLPSINGIRKACAHVDAGSGAASYFLSLLCELENEVVTPETLVRSFEDTITALKGVLSPGDFSDAVAVPSALIVVLGKDNNAFTEEALLLWGRYYDATLATPCG